MSQVPGVAQGAGLMRPKNHGKKSGVAYGGQVANLIKIGDILIDYHFWEAAWPDGQLGAWLSGLS
jgi:hypothetical protein